MRRGLWSRFAQLSGNVRRKYLSNLAFFPVFRIHLPCEAQRLGGPNVSS
jgi:hypothetical protein